jgi:hypothetical protein
MVPFPIYGLMELVLSDDLVQAGHGARIQASLIHCGRSELLGVALS